MQFLDELLRIAQSLRLIQGFSVVAVVVWWAGFMFFRWPACAAVSSAAIVVYAGCGLVTTMTLQGRYGSPYAFGVLTAVMIAVTWGISWHRRRESAERHEAKGWSA